IGPGKAHSPTRVAATVLAGNYATGADSRLISPPFVVPATSQNPRLRFWHWYDFVSPHTGTVEIKETGGLWQPLSSPYKLNGSAVWSRPAFDLSAHAGKIVQV